jgi:hypothetical protein
VVSQTAHPRDSFGERDGAACRWTDSFIDVKQSTSDQDSSGIRCPAGPGITMSHSRGQSSTVTVIPAQDSSGFSSRMLRRVGTVQVRPLGARQNAELDDAP